MSATVLTKPGQTIPLTYERTLPSGETEVKKVQIAPRRSPGQRLPMLGVIPLMGTKVDMAAADPRLPEEERLQSDDVIVEVDGEPVADIDAIIRLVVRGEGDWVTLTVERPGEDGSSTPQRLTRRVRTRLRFGATGGRMKQGGDLLGLVPLRTISVVSEGSPAQEAGLEPGDVVQRWGMRSDPVLGEITENIAKNANQAIGVTVLRRDDQGTYRPVSVKVTPKTKGVLWFKSDRPEVGIHIFSEHCNDLLIVADILETIPGLTEAEPAEPTPAARLKAQMPRGSHITHVNDESVRTWNELTRRFIELAGSDVKLTWQYQDGPEQSGTIHVPQTLGTNGTFMLPPGERITKIAGQSRIEIMKNGSPAEYSAQSWRGARKLLSQHVGESIEIEYRDLRASDPRSATVTVTEEMLNTWRLRIHHEVDFITRPVTTVLREPNPFKAMMIGVQKTYDLIQHVYITMERMIISRSLGLDNVTGPVGIVKVGSQYAEHNLMQLLKFLAMISANLAVINFLPMPIVDGGLFVFLLIEKIKGSPISIKVQVATQLIGLALIIGIFVMVTVNDIARFFG